jgi:hypothetical protein
VKIFRPPELEVAGPAVPEARQETKVDQVRIDVRCSA